MVVANEFQLFHPIGGRGASVTGGRAPIACVPAASPIAPAPVNAPFNTPRRLARSGLVTRRSPYRITQSYSARYAKPAGVGRATTSPFKAEQSHVAGEKDFAQRRRGA